MDHDGRKGPDGAATEYAGLLRGRIDILRSRSAATGQAVRVGRARAGLTRCSGRRRSPGTGPGRTWRR
jgi:hypothetical protein